MGVARRQPYRDALDQAVLELEGLRAQQSELRSKRREIDSQIVQLESLVRQLCGIVPEARADQDIQTQRVIDLDVGKAAYKLVVETMFGDPSREWRAKDLQQAASNENEELGYKAVHNALQYLYERGALIRVRRGVYRAVGYGFTVEGFGDYG